MKTSKATKNKRKAFAWKKRFNCRWCDSKEPHCHSLQQILDAQRS
jgi:hypothetical protein